MSRKVKVFLFAFMAVALLDACGGGGSGGGSGGGGGDIKSWTGAVKIDAGANYSSAPKVALDANGNAFAVWYQNDGTTHYDIYANRYDTGTGWSTAVEIDASAHLPSPPQVAVDANGNAIAVWAQSDGTIYDVYARRYDAGTGWGTAEIIDAGAYSAGHPQLGFDANGNAVAVWIQSYGANYSNWRMYARHYDAGTGWGTAEIIDTGANDAYDPQVAVNADGNAIAVWRQYDGAYLSIYANQYDAGTGWGTAEIIDAGANNAYDPKVAIDANGNAAAIWYQDDGRSTYESYRVYANRYDAGTGSWGTATEIDTGAIYEARVPQVAVDSDGNAIAVWKQHDGMRWHIYAKRYDAGTGWGTAEVIDTGASNYDPQVSFDANGNAFAVWQQWDGTYLSIYARRYDAGTGSWGTAKIIDAGANDASSPQVSFDANGNAVAVWIQDDSKSTSTTNSVYANRYE